MKESSAQWVCGYQPSQCTMEMAIELRTSSTSRPSSRLEPENENLRMEIAENERKRRHEMELERMKCDLEYARLTLELEKVKLEELKIQTTEANRKNENTDQLFQASVVFSAVTGACGAVTGCWGGVVTVGAMGAAFGAATVVAPVTGTLAVACGIGWVYKKARST